MLYNCCNTPNCSHPKPTLSDWWALAYCYYPRTVLAVEAVVKGLAFLFVMFTLWVFVCAVMLLG